jgi:hypothetical protein
MRNTLHGTCVESERLASRLPDVIHRQTQAKCQTSGAHHNKCVVSDDPLLLQVCTQHCLLLAYACLTCTRPAHFGLPQALIACHALPAQSQCILVHRPLGWFKRLLNGDLLLGLGTTTGVAYPRHRRSRWQYQMQKAR